MASNISPYLRLIQRTGGTRHPGGLSLTDSMLRRVGLTENSRLLDVGCGAGHTSAHIVNTYGCQVFGVDISPEAIERAHDLYKLNFSVGDISALDFPDSSFDVVLCESVLIFVENKHAALKEMGRLVKPGGFLALNELCQSSSDDANKTKDYFARPEMGGFLEPAAILTDWFTNSWRMVVMDEQPFDIMAQLKADWSQWGNFKGLTQFLEAGFHILTNKELQADMMAVLRLGLETPRNILQQMNILLLLAQKKPSN
jgi:ubiquinone/menaquinone biosynthesis C-methylase UbiE